MKHTEYKNYNEMDRLYKEAYQGNMGSPTTSTEGAIHIETFAGYGGIGLGLELAGIPIDFTVSVEIEAYAAANLVKKTNYGKLAPGVLFSDVRTFPFRKFRGIADILSGGFNCQPFSSEGHRKADEDPRHLFPYLKEGVKEMLPLFVVFENVKGICSATLSRDTDSFKKGTPVLQYVLGELELLGYTATAVPATAAEVGANHSRFRWFIVAVLNSEGQRLRRDEINGKESKEQSTNKTFFRNANRGIITRSLRNAVFPNKKKALQKHQEPPRVIRTDAINLIESSHRNGYVSSKHEVGGTGDASSYRLDNDTLRTSASSPEDEMRLLGNGVCPAQASVAIKLALKEIYKRWV